MTRPVFIDSDTVRTMGIRAFAMAFRANGPAPRAESKVGPLYDEKEVEEWIASTFGVAPARDFKGSVA